jgi:hypothetical protein
LGSREPALAPAIENEDFNTQDFLVLDELSERAANSRGL